VVPGGVIVEIVLNVPRCSPQLDVLTFIGQAERAAERKQSVGVGIPESGIQGSQIRASREIVVGNGARKDEGEGVSSGRKSFRTVGQS
jgi:hypothetical protein